MKHLDPPPNPPPPTNSSCSVTHLCLVVVQNWMKPKKKVGRPITYNGDPNAPELSEAERRKVKRRIANRESARRVQQRRKEMIDELQHKVGCYRPPHPSLSPYSVSPHAPLCITHPMRMIVDHEAIGLLLTSKAAELLKV